MLEQDLDGVVRFHVCIMLYQSFGYFPTMAEDDDALRSLSIRIDTAEGKIRSIISTLDSVVQELKRLSLKIDDQSLVDSTH